MWPVRTSGCAKNVKHTLDFKDRVHSHEKEKKVTIAG